MKEKFLEQHGWKPSFGTDAEYWADPSNVEINGTTCHATDAACLIQLERAFDLSCRHSGCTKVRTSPFWFCPEHLQGDDGELVRNIKGLLESNDILLGALKKIENDFSPDRPEEFQIAVQEMRECAGEAISEAFTAFPGCIVAGCWKPRTYAEVCEDHT